MNAPQTAVRTIGILLMVPMVLFPPWKISFTAEDSTTGAASIGYHPVWYRFQQEENDSRTNVQQRIDLVRLGLQLGGALILTNAALALLRKKDSQA